MLAIVALILLGAAHSSDAWMGFTVIRHYPQGFSEAYVREFMLYCYELDDDDTNLDYAKEQLRDFAAGNNEQNVTVNIELPSGLRVDGSDFSAIRFCYTSPEDEQNVMISSSNPRLSQVYHQSSNIYIMESQYDDDAAGNDPAVIMHYMQGPSGVVASTPIIKGLQKASGGLVAPTPIIKGLQKPSGGLVAPTPIIKGLQWGSGMAAPTLATKGLLDSGMGAIDAASEFAAFDQQLDAAGLSDMVDNRKKIILEYSDRYYLWSYKKGDDVESYPEAAIV